MNKYTYLTVGLLMASTMALAECVGGTWITANSVDNNPNGNCTATTCNGATFCRSNGKMNWWSAFTWCASNGLHLATFQEMCPGIATLYRDMEGACPNLQGTGGDYAWCELGLNDNGAFRIHMKTGTTEGAPRTYTQYALCK